MAREEKRNKIRYDGDSKRDKTDAAPPPVDKGGETVVCIDRLRRISFNSRTDVKPVTNFEQQIHEVREEYEINFYYPFPSLRCNDF